MDNGFLNLPAFNYVTFASQQVQELDMKRSPRVCLEFSTSLVCPRKPSILIYTERPFAESGS